MYKDEVIMRHMSIFTNGETKTTGVSLNDLKKSKIDFEVAFANDNDIQEMTITSTNFGFTRTYMKLYK